MNEGVEGDIGLLLTVLNSLLDNLGWFTAIFFIFIFRNSFSSFIARLVGVDVSNGDSKLAINAVPPSSNELIEKKEESLVSESNVQELESTVNKNKVNGWFGIVNDALERGDAEEGRKAFKVYELETTDLNKLYPAKGLFLYLLFKKANDRSAIPLLEKHVKESPNEKLRYDALKWLSNCFCHSKQFNRNIELWLKESTKLKPKEVNVNVTKELALAYSANDDLEQAKDLLINSLRLLENNKQKAALYIVLADVEEKLGNKIIGACCRDKVVEYDPENLEEVFNSAYNANEADINDLAISNYTLLTKMSPKNAAGWNNLGVQANEVGLKVKAMENYAQAIKLKETLAISNQGYALLHAGFIEEAECMAKKALECENIHDNVYSLMSKIATVKKEENKKWLDIQNKASRRQVKLRKYIEKYYLGDANELNGIWEIGDSEVTIVADEPINISWFSTSGLSGFNTKFLISGNVTGASFQGKYKSENGEEAKKTLLSTGNTFNVDCFGYVDEGHIHVFSLERNNERYVDLKKKIT